MRLLEGNDNTELLLEIVCHLLWQLNLHDHLQFLLPGAGQNQPISSICRACSSACSIDLALLTLALLLILIALPSSTSVPNPVRRISCSSSLLIADGSSWYTPSLAAADPGAATVAVAAGVEGVGRNPVLSS